MNLLRAAVLMTATVLSLTANISAAAENPKIVGKTTTVVAPDGVKLSVHEFGNPSGKELLLIHGFAQSYLAFAKQYESKLLEKYRIVSFDLRGHGESDKPMPVEYYADGKRWADDVDAVIKATGLKKPYLAGWSMGGRVLGNYLNVHGTTNLSGVIFVSTRTVMQPGQSFSAPKWTTVPATRAEGTDERIRATQDFLRACFFLQPQTDEFAYMLAYNMLTPLHARKGSLMMSGNFDVALKSLSIPVLIMHGTKDELIQPEAAVYGARMIPRAQLKLIEGAGHSIFWEKPQEFDQAVDNFISGG